MTQAPHGITTEDHLLMTQDISLGENIVRLTMGTERENQKLEAARNCLMFQIGNITDNVRPPVNKG